MRSAVAGWQLLQLRTRTSTALLLLLQLQRLQLQQLLDCVQGRASRPWPPMASLSATSKRQQRNIMHPDMGSRPCTRAAMGTIWATMPTPSAPRRPETVSSTINNSKSR